MPRGKDSVHECYILSKDDAGKPKATCKYCGKPYVPNTTRQKKHILQECKLVPAIVRARFSEFRCPASLTNNVAEENDVDNPSSVGSGSVRNTSSPTPSCASSSASSSTTVCHSAGLKRKSSSSLDRFVDHTGPEEKKFLDAAFARAMYASGMPFSAFSTLYWNDFFQRVRPSYKPPTPYFLSGALLDAEYNICKASNDEKVKNAAALGIMTDSYTNIRSESVIDILVTTPEPVLFKQVFRGTQRETGEYVGNELLSVIRAIDPKKFWLLVTDNAANMQVAWRSVTQEFSHITATGCASHCWDLLFKDLIKSVTVIDKYYKNARAIVKTIKKSSNALAVFQSKQKEKYDSMECVTLKLPGKTRWAGAAILLNSLIKNKAALEETVLVEDLEIGRTVRKCILESKFWDRIKCISAVLSPIHAAITLIEGNRALLSDVFYLHTKINQCVSESVVNLPLSSAEKRTVKDLLEDRKNYTIRPIHYAAYLLDPRYQGEGLNDEEIAEAIVFISRMARHMGIDEGVAIGNLGEFRIKVGFFGISSVIESSRNLHPAVWWRGVCGTQALAPIAATLLTMPPTATECERRWSDHGFVHGKSRNRLLNTRVTKLVTTRATLIANLQKGKKKDPLSATEMANYFETYVSALTAARRHNGEGEGDVAEEEHVDSDLESEWEEELETDWEVDVESEENEESDGDEEDVRPQRRHNPPHRMAVQTAAAAARVVQDTSASANTPTSSRNTRSRVRKS